MPKSYEIVEADQFDRHDLDDMLSMSRSLRESFDALEDATPKGADLGVDMWSSLLRVAPKKNDGQTPPAWRTNETLIDRLWEAERYRDLKQHTVGDPIAAAAALGALANKDVTEMLDRLGDVQEQAEKAQDAADRLEQAMGGGQGEGDGDEEGEGDGGGTAETADPTADVEALRSVAEAEAEKLEEMLDRQLPQIDSAIRAALDEAADAAEDQAEVAAGWGLDPGTAQRMDPADRIRLMEALSDQRMRDIADLVGVMHNLAIGQRNREFTLMPGEIVGTMLGGDLDQLVDEELAALGIEELEDLLLLRVLNDEALIFETRAYERAGRGAIIYLEDQSGSMMGAKARWSKAFGLALLRVAREQDRAFHAFTFKGAGSWERFDFPNPRGPVTEEMVAFASTVADGGTEVTQPLDEAVGLLEAEYVSRGNTEGDLVLATDGEVGVPPAWLAAFHEKQEALAFHVYGLAIQARLSTLNALCTHVGDVTDLTSGRDVADVFAAVN